MNNLAFGGPYLEKFQEIGAAQIKSFTDLKRPTRHGTNMSQLSPDKVLSQDESKGASSPDASPNPGSSANLKIYQEKKNKKQ